MDSFKCGLELRSINSRWMDDGSPREGLGTGLSFPSRQIQVREPGLSQRNILKPWNAFLCLMGEDGVPLESGCGLSMFLRDGWSGLRHGDRFHGWNHPRVPNMGLWVRFAPLSSKLAEKTQKDKWDELIASSVIPLAATGMLWNYRLFFFFLKNLFLSLIFPLLWINFFIVNYFKDQTRIEKSIMTTYLPTIKLDQILTLCHICIRYHLKK